MIEGATSGPDAFTMAPIDGIDVFLFLALLILPIPLLVAALEFLVQPWLKPAALAIHAAFIALMTAVFSWQIVQGQSQSSTARTLIPFGVLFLVLWAYMQSETIKQVFVFLALAPAVIVAVTLISEPAVSTVLPTAEPEAAEPVSAPFPIVVLVLDEFPLVALMDGKRELDGRLFPGFARLASTSNWYRNARSNADYTVRALPSMLTGRMPTTEETPPTRHNYPENLFTTLEAAGYDVRGSEARTTLCPADVCGSPDGRVAKAMMLLGHGANYSDVLPDDAESKIIDRLARKLPKVDDNQADRLESFFDGIELGDSTFDFAHIELPHIPWQLLPDGRTHNAPFFAGIVEHPDIDDDETWQTLESDLSMQRMMLQLGYVDSRLDALLDKLEASDLWKRSMLVVMADHGAAFVPGLGRRRISVDNAGWQVPVPLFVKQPGQTVGEVVDEPVELLDVTPSILDKLTLKVGEGVVGVPLGKRTGAPLSTYVSASGREVEITETELKDGLEHALDYRNQRFGEGSFFALAGDRQLIGRRPESAGLEPLKVQPDFGLHTDDLDLTGDTVESYWSGTVTEDPKPMSGRVAIAVNGRIATTVPAWMDLDDPSMWRVQALLPPDSLRQGANEVQAYILP